MRDDARRVGPTRRFPLSAVVGQDEARLALLLAAIDPAVGGVLLRGQKGSAKSTLARGLAGLLPGGAAFVELPLGATEDRVLGSLDLSAALSDGVTQFRPGLLAAAHGGVLYVDDVNLLPNPVVDVLLDVAASGVNHVERDGVSHEHPSRFVLVGSMNPEEGELRPQFLDRFGLAVEVKAPTEPAERAEVVRRRLTHDAGNAVGGHEGDIVLRARLAAALPADLPESVVDFACHLAVSVGAEGLRADLVLCRAAAALAGWEGRSVATEADVERVAPLALGHRGLRRPFDPPTLPADELERALDATRHAFAHMAPAGGEASDEGGPPAADDGEPASDDDDAPTSDGGGGRVVEAEAGYDGPGSDDDGGGGDETKPHAGTVEPATADAPADRGAGDDASGAAEGGPSSESNDAATGGGDGGDTSAPDLVTGAAAGDAASSPTGETDEIAGDAPAPTAP